jgi:hypothetical protein
VPRKPFIAIALALTLPACSVEPTVAAPPIPFSDADRVAIALAQGDRAEGRKAKSQAAQILLALRAKPADTGTVDLAEMWAKQSGSREVIPVYRGRILGPAYRNGMIPPGSAASTQQLFLAGKIAQISVSASQGSRLNITVTDKKGEAICETVVGKPVGNCKWIPQFSERFEVTIGNVGPKNARYFLVVN